MEKNNYITDNMFKVVQLLFYFVLLVAKNNMALDRKDHYLFFNWWTGKLVKMYIFFYS